MKTLTLFQQVIDREFLPAVGFGLFLIAFLIGYMMYLKIKEKLFVKQDWLFIVIMTIFGVLAISLMFNLQWI